MTVHAADRLPAATTDRAPVAGRVRRATLTWFSGAAYGATTIVVGLLATPILLRLLSAERIGAGRAVTEWMGYLLLADLGLGSATAVLLVRARAQGALETAAVAKLAMRALVIVTLIIAPLGIALAWVLPWLISTEMSLDRELRVAGLIAAGALVLLPWSVFRMVLETAQRGYLVNAALLAQSLTITGTSLLLAWLGFGLSGLTAAAAVGGIIFVVLTTRSALRLMTAWRDVPAANIPKRELATIALPLAAAGAGNRLNLMTDAAVVGLLVGAAPVAVMLLTQRLITLCAAQVNSLVNSSWAALAELRASGLPEIFEARVAELTRLVVGLGCAVTGAVAAWNGHFVRLWVGNAMYGGEALSALTALAMVTIGFTSLFSFLIDTHGDTRRRLPISLAGAALNVALSIALVKWIGISGAILATTLAYLSADAWNCPRLVCRLYNIRPPTVVWAVARGAGAGLPWAIAMWWLARAVPPIESWIMLSFCGAAVAGATIAYCCLAVLTAEERAQWRQPLCLVRAIARKGDEIP